MILIVVTFALINLIEWWGFWGCIKTELGCCWWSCNWLV